MTKRKPYLDGIYFYSTYTSGGNVHTSYVTKETPAQRQARLGNLEWQQTIRAFKNSVRWMS